MTREATESEAESEPGATHDINAALDADVAIRTADHDEIDAIRRLLDAAMLTVPTALAERVAGGDAVVAVDAGVTDANADAGRDESDTGHSEADAGRDRGDVVGALVLEGSHVNAVAVRRSRRGAGVGAALVAAAAERTEGALTATFRPSVRPFYEALGFDVEPARPDDPDATRLRGRLGGDEATDP